MSIEDKLGHSESCSAIIAVAKSPCRSFLMHLMFLHKSKISTKAGDTYFDGISERRTSSS